MRFWRCAARPWRLVIPEPVGDAVRLQRVEAFVVEERLGVAAGGGVASAGGEEIGADRSADGRFGGEGVVDEVAEEDRGDIGRLQLVGEEHAEAGFERGVVEHGGEQEADEHWLAVGFCSGFGLDLVPDAVFSGVGEVFGEFVHRRGEGGRGKGDWEWC